MIFPVHNNTIGYGIVSIACTRSLRDIRINGLRYLEVFPQNNPTAASRIQRWKKTKLKGRRLYIVAL